jgi:predicted nucleic acid-binding protein
MTVKVFADTNIVGYLISTDSVKRERAKAIMRDKPVISTQVANKFINICMKKTKLGLTVTHRLVEALLTLCLVMPIDVQTVRDAIKITQHYHFSHWDSLIIAAAQQAGCTILYSEDLQHGQLIDQLTLINPFQS